RTVEQQLKISAFIQIQRRLLHKVPAEEIEFHGILAESKADRRCDKEWCVCENQIKGLTTDGIERVTDPAIQVFHPVQGRVERGECEGGRVKVRTDATVVVNRGYTCLRPPAGA